MLKVNRLLLGNTGVLGVAVREFLEGRPELVRPLWEQLVGLQLEDPPVVAFPFADARGALRLIADRKAHGKVVLSRQVSEPPALDSGSRAGAGSRGGQGSRAAASSVRKRS